MSCEGPKAARAFWPKRKWAHAERVEAEEEGAGFVELEGNGGLV